MSPVYSEAAFGDAIVAAMRERGRRLGNPACYRPEMGLDTSELFAFIGTTQADAWAELLGYYGNDPGAAQRGFARRLDKRLDKAISADGLLQVLRKGGQGPWGCVSGWCISSLVTSGSVSDNYRANRLTVVRELAYATKQTDQGSRLDLALFLNGIPVATAEPGSYPTSYLWELVWQQLAEALSRETGKIVTVMLHTFPALVDYLKQNPTGIAGSRFAIVVDEAHSSQSGDAASAVRSTLRDLGWTLTTRRRVRPRRAVTPTRGCAVRRSRGSCEVDLR